MIKQMYVNMSLPPKKTKVLVRESIYYWVEVDAEKDKMNNLKYVDDENYFGVAFGQKAIRKFKTHRKDYKSHDSEVDWVQVVEIDDDGYIEDYLQ